MDGRFLPFTDEKKGSRILNWVIVSQAVVLAIGLAILGYRKLSGGGEATAASPSPAAAQSGDGNPARPSGPPAATQPTIPVKWTDAPLGDLTLPKVVVEKSARVMTVFDLEEPVKSYRVAVGENPADKQVEGDLATPEGHFYICIRKGRNQTPYTRSLGLSYPNAEDADRGLAAGLINDREHERIVYAVSRSRRPPWDTRLGGEIMIHGKRDGRTTTKGCIAVEDHEILELFDALEMGTVVEIKP